MDEIDEMDELKESFLIEAGELLVEAEGALLLIEKGESFSSHYDAIFRALHSIKGGAGMLGMVGIQDCLHEAESRFQSFKGNAALPTSEISYFLSTLDVVGKMLHGSEGVAPPEAPPATEQPVAPDLREAKSEKPAIQFETALRAAVIDDEPDIVTLVTEILLSAGFVVFGFTDPEQALLEVPKLDVDIVLSDIKMPGKSGFDVLQAFNEGKRHYPVIFVSGYLDRDVLIQSLNLGAEGVIEKPFRETYVKKLALQAATRSRLLRMLDQSINLLMYQYSDFDDYLKESGKDDVRHLIETEMRALIAMRQVLRDSRKVA